MRYWVGALSTTGLALVLAAPGYAQTTGGGSAPVAEIETVTVTAERRTEDEQKVPIALTVMSGDMIHTQDIKSALDLQNFAPSLSVVASLGSRDTDVFSIRGQNQPFGGADPGVQTYFADVPFNPSGHGSYFDLANIQVLNGPQGTLFGRSTTGGAVLFEPQRPTDEFGGYLDTQYGNYDLTELSGALNVPVIGDTLLARAAFDVASQQGFTQTTVIPSGAAPYTEDSDNLNSESFRFGVTFRPFPHFENYTVFDYLHERSNGTGGAITGVNTNTLAQEAAGFNGGPCTFPPTTMICGELFSFENALVGPGGALPTQQGLGPRSVLSDIPIFFRRQSWGATDIATYDVMSDVHLKNIFAYRSDEQWPAFDYSGTALPLIDIPNPNTWVSNSIQVTEEFQVLGESFNDNLNWIVGFYHELDHPGGPSEVQTDEFGGGVTAPPLSSTVDQTLTNGGTSDAVYASATYKLSGWAQGLSLTAGGRYTFDHKVADSLACTQNIAQPLPCPFPLVGTPAVSTANFSAPTWNLAANYQVNDDTMVYATYRRGYKSGGFNSGAGNATDYEEFKPEYLTDLEVGAKNNWTILGVPGRTNLDAYYGWYQDIQKNDLVEVEQLTLGGPVPEGLSALTFNAAKATIKGFEFQSTIIPNEYVELNLFYSYTDATYQNFMLPQAILIGLTGTQSEVGLTDLSGGAFGFTPRTKIGISPRLRLPMAPSLGSIVLNGTFYWQSSEWFTDLGAEETINPSIPGEYGVSPQQKAYVLANFRLDWNNFLGGPIDVSAFVNNAFDKVYAVGGDALLNETGTSATIYGPPRMFGAELRYRFGGDAKE